MSEWQPIETAPKDVPQPLPRYGNVRGRDILLTNGTSVYVGHWEERYQSGYMPQKWYPISNATHWMPLPDPPK